MEVTNLNVNQPLHLVAGLEDNNLNESTKSHLTGPTPYQSTTMTATSPQKFAVLENGYATPADLPSSKSDSTGSVAQQASPSDPSPKHVAFELLLDEESKMKARIPMRVQIFPHDTTDSIVTTVKNFYGIYDGTGSGVSFEDENGTTLIARYENLQNNMTVYVRVIPNHGYSTHQPYRGRSQHEADTRPSLGEPFRTSSDQCRPPSRPTSRVSRKRSVSLSGRGRRSESTKKPARSGNKSRGSSTHGSFHEDALVPYSDSDHASITSSKKGRSDHFASSDISTENILHDGRRKRLKFESSELPLFAPPQVPRTTSTSSVSPQRRSTLQDGASPFARPTHPFGAQHPLHSPQGFKNHEQLYSLQNHGNSPYAAAGAPHHGHHLRERPNFQPYGLYGNRANSYGILPTPDPTIASCISDEDVAMQLIRLGDASNFSHGRTSMSTADDAFSGIADASSVTGATSDGEMSADESGPLRKARQVECNGGGLGDDGINEAHRLDKHPTTTNTEYEHEALQDSQAAKAKRAKTKPSSTASSKTKQGTISKSAKVTKARSGTIPRKSKTTTSNGSNTIAPPPPPSAMSQVVRKAPAPGLNFQHQLAADEEDLSTKPRCQRCRKSKKGCDRQRPCQRCKDAGIGIEGCISEDEGNGRKGRYGRHMGVPIKKVTNPAPAGPEPHVMGPSLAAVAGPVAQAGSKKRKR
ncbi:hypothetical protein PRK78_006758 [Emydomyces testavorans]|uniref:Zn(2)-C6 fungal-type domain-containing protein n=1 Tax=Emydomyces testavorans TaxID=2070801 RepID=A0AAF0DN33_9EURO|nr:hypothetical protein PRK78_006758 [Emydomyces testavorans]